MEDVFYGRRGHTFCLGLSRADNKVSEIKNLCHVRSKLFYYNKKLVKLKEFTDRNYTLLHICLRQQG